jgi:hypothetical protein
MGVDIIQGTDREFTLRITKKASQDPFDFTGITGTNLSIKLPGEAGDLDYTLTANANGSKLEIVSALSGKIKLILSDIDTALLKKGDSQNMELTIKQGAGPDYVISKVQFSGQLNVKPSLFEA